jgi:endonuclease/exonuclease/phosphatase family metal-dependent hydrolase
MPVKVAFWNVNMGVNSAAERKSTFEQWVTEVQPDLLFLEEVSYRLTQTNLENMADMSQIGRVGTLNVHLLPTTKDLVTLADDPTDFNSRALRFPGLGEAKRMLIKTTSSSDGSLVIWSIHANASTRGGREAVNAVVSHLGTLAGRGTVVGGDFNCPIANAPGAVHPLDYTGAALAFTQWNKTDGTTDINRYKNNRQLFRKIEPHGVIDYLIHGAGRTVVALPNCTNQKTWTDILMQFDHCPVVYNITA